MGIEIDPQRAEEAKQAVEQAGLSGRVTILGGNALEQSLQDATGIIMSCPPMHSAAPRRGEAGILRWSRETFLASLLHDLP